MGYRARYLTHPPHPTHCAFHSQQVQASWEWLFFSDYDALFQVHIGKVLADPDTDADISQCGERISVTQTIHEIHNCILLFTKSGNFCVTTVPVTGPSLITALQLCVLPRTLSAELPLNYNNNKISVVTLRRRRIWWKVIYISSPNYLPSNLPVYVRELSITLWPVWHILVQKSGRAEVRCC
jgi:hypothetical protein